MQVGDAAGAAAQVGAQDIDRAGVRNLDIQVNDVTSAGGGVELVQDRAGALRGRENPGIEREVFLGEGNFTIAWDCHMVGRVVISGEGNCAGHLPGSSNLNVANIGAIVATDRVEDIRTRELV